MIRSTALVLFVAAATAAALPGAAVASKGGEGGGTTSTTEPSLVLTSDPSFGSTVSLAAAYQAMKWVPELSLSCSVNGQVVYLVAHALGGGSSATAEFTLSSQKWVASGGGPAECRARLYYYTWQGKTQTGVVYLAEQSFVTS